MINRTQKILKIIMPLLLFIAYIAMGTGFSLAADTAPEPIAGSAAEINSLIQTVIDLVFALTGFIIIGMIIVGGIQYSTAGGNPQATSKAKEKITNAITALLVIVFLYPFLLWLIPGGGGIFQ